MSCLDNSPRLIPFPHPHSPNPGADRKLLLFRELQASNPPASIEFSVHKPLKQVPPT